MADRVSITLTSDCVAELNQIINHPDILPGHLTNGPINGPIDVSPVIESGGFGVVGKGFGFLLHPLGAGVYEVHTSIMPEYRNRSVEITTQAADKIFTETTAVEVVTRVKNNKPAKRLALSVGMRKTFDRDGYEFFSLPLCLWAAKCDRFLTLGEQFHETLESSGVETNHDKDDNHDQYVGIALQMGKLMPQKAEWFYNCWAALAGYHPIRLLPDGSADIGNAIIRLNGDKVEVVKCQ